MLTENGSAIFKRWESPLSLEADTIFIDLVILAMFWVPVIRALTVISRAKREKAKIDMKNKS